MLLAWMAYAVLFGSLTYGAAFAADRIAATWERRQRFIWAGAVVVAAAVPVIFATLPRSRASGAADLASVESPAIGTNVSIAFGGAPRPPIRESLRTRAQRLVTESDAYLVGAWILGSVAWMALLARAAIDIRRRGAHWREVEVDGSTVLVAPSVGPAVVGVLAPRVVIPQWALSLDAPARELMLRHEAEHIRAHDPLLALSAAFATALFPWNPALWLLVRRLRLAIEIDCDARVLRTSAHRREYGELLLTVGARKNASLPFATSLAERRPFLERRIRAMTSNTPRHPRIVSAACLALVAVVTTAAVRAPRPAPLITAATPIVPRLPRHEAVLPSPAPVAQVTPPTPEPAPSTAPRTPRVAQALPLDDTPAVKLTAVAPPGARRGSDTLSIDDIRKLIAAHHPSALTGDPDINTVTLIVDARGNYVTSVAESRPFIIGGGRGGRGRVGGGGDTAFSGAGLRGRVGGGGGAVQDSAEVKRVLDMVQAKLARLTGDTVIVRNQAPLIVVDGVVQRGEDSAKVAVLEAKLAGDRVGLNMDVVARLIDPATIDSLQIHTFAAGQLGAAALRVYVIRQRQ